MVNYYERVDGQTDSECKYESLEQTHKQTNIYDEINESKPADGQSNGNATDVSYSCVLCNFNSDKDGVEFRRKSYYPLLIFIIAGAIVSCLGLVFSYATDNMTVLGCFLAVGGWSVLVGVAFQFRRYFMFEQCYIIERCLDIDDGTEKDKEKFGGP